LKIRITREDIGELRSPAEMRKLLKRKVAEQNRICAICLEEFTDYSDVVPDTKIPKGWEERRDDHPTISSRALVVQR